MNNWVAASPYTVVDSLLKEKKLLLLPKMICFLSPFLVVFVRIMKWNN